MSLGVTICCERLAANDSREHYAGIGVQGLSDIDTMADMNRVLWGLKAMLHRRQENNPSFLETKRAA